MKFLLVALCGLGLLVGCGTVSQAAITDRQVPLQPVLIAPSATPTPKPTRTSVPTPTLTPRPTNTPTPIAVPLLPTLDPEAELLDLRLAGVRGSRSGQLLRREAVADLKALIDAARRDGFVLEIRSAYRSYAEQASTFEGWVQYELSSAAQTGKPISRKQAIAYAATYSAKPGTSEHQTGLTVDLLPQGAPEIGFRIPDPLKDWLNANAYKYGWVQSYPIKYRDGELITYELMGYTSEPWHWRWQGRDSAKSLYDQGYLDTDSLLVPPTLPRICDAEHDPCMILSAAPAKLVAIPTSTPIAVAE
ncbi:peptidase M15B and M15C DD-carboxypeptidase VanY/endolysin [Herpetosiphon aurantiacus DSM 785]|uniref:Peptidase M15B and M15C DD-carboxypeptidase VanY/endolysin n=3 Tax=Herpetosiphon TaxID=64 RepID=A9AXS4_HERA2|nr:peptidase M15B and M15C DD-carboxypeptidase VanY/endolysin [Herpetosiphon aurantiacus DSM 785]